MLLYILYHCYNILRCWCTNPGSLRPGEKDPGSCDSHRLYININRIYLSIWPYTYTDIYYIKAHFPKALNFFCQLGYLSCSIRCSKQTCGAPAYSQPIYSISRSHKKIQIPRILFESALINRRCWDMFVEAKQLYLTYVCNMFIIYIIKFSLEKRMNYWNEIVYWIFM